MTRAVGGGGLERERWMERSIQLEMAHNALHRRNISAETANYACSSKANQGAKTPLGLGLLQDIQT